MPEKEGVSKAIRGGRGGGKKTKTLAGFKVGKRMLRLPFFRARSAALQKVPRKGAEWRVAEGTQSLTGGS